MEMQSRKTSRRGGFHQLLVNVECHCVVLCSTLLSADRAEYPEYSVFVDGTYPGLRGKLMLLFQALGNSEQGPPGSSDDNDFTGIGNLPHHTLSNFLALIACLLLNNESL